MATCYPRFDSAPCPVRRTPIRTQFHKASGALHFLGSVMGGLVFELTEDEAPIANLPFVTARSGIVGLRVGRGRALLVLGATSEATVVL